MDSTAKAQHLPAFHSNNNYFFIHPSILLWQATDCTTPLTFKVELNTEQLEQNAALSVYLSIHLPTFFPSTYF